MTLSTFVLDISVCFSEKVPKFRMATSNYFRLIESQKIHEPPDREDQSVPIPVRVMGTYRSSGRFCYYLTERNSWTIFDDSDNSFLTFRAHCIMSLFGQLRVPKSPTYIVFLFITFKFINFVTLYQIPV